MPFDAFAVNMSVNFEADHSLENARKVGKGRPTFCISLEYDTKAPTAGPLEIWGDRPLSLDGRLISRLA